MKKRNPQKKKKRKKKKREKIIKPCKEPCRTPSDKDFLVLKDPFVSYGTLSGNQGPNHHRYDKGRIQARCLGFSRGFLP